MGERRGKRCAEGCTCGRHRKNLQQAVSQELRVSKNVQGEEILHYAPCDRFPDGHKVLIPSNSLRERLNAAREDNCAAHATLRQAELERLRKAQVSLAAGESVPPEKRPI